MKHSFRSAVDWWYYVLILIVPAMVFLPLVLTPNPDGLVVIIIVGVLATILPIWLLLTTVYEVDEESLVVRSGPFRWNVQKNEIKSVEPSSSVLSSPALSLDRLRIDYGAGKFVLVSPRQRDEFIESLQVDK